MKTMKFYTPFSDIIGEVRGSTYSIHAIENRKLNGSVSSSVVVAQSQYTCYHACLADAISIEFLNRAIYSETNN